YIGTGNIRFVSVQFDPAVPDYQPALQDKRVRQALYIGIDRAAYADVAILGHPERTADAILPDDDPLYSYVKGGMDRYAFDPNRGNNRGKWCNQQYEDLVARYRTGLRQDDRGASVRQIQDLIAEELPYMVLCVGIAAPFARRGVTAFRDDYTGGADAGRIYGT